MNPLAATTRLNGFGKPAVTIGLIVALAVLASGEPPRVETRFFNGKDLAGWKSADMSHWSVVDRAIVGRSEAPILKNDFLWCDVEVRDFYLSVQVKQIPFARNGGIQFRSRPEGTEALGYQADVGGEVWGNLHHEGGRLKLAAPVNVQKSLWKEEWNHYEIRLSWSRATAHAFEQSPAHAATGHGSRYGIIWRQHPCVAGVAGLSSRLFTVRSGVS